MTTDPVLALALAFLRLLLPASQRDPVLGDVAEEYSLRARSGSALPWLVGEVCRSVPSLLWMAMRKGLILTIAIALVVWLGASVVESLAVAAVSGWLGDRGSVGVMTTLIGTLTMAGGGYVAARLRNGAANVVASVVLIAMIAVSLTGAYTAPFWYQLMFVLLAPLAPLFGGVVAAHRLRPHR